MNRYVLCLLGCLPWLAACQKAPIACQPRAGMDGLRSLHLASAVADADRAFAVGDKRLIGVYGYSMEVPGLAGDPYVLDKSRRRMLDATGDAYCTSEEMSLNHNARAYARVYNGEMLRCWRASGISLPAASASTLAR